MKRLFCILVLLCCAGPSLAVNSESHIRFRRDPGFYQTGRFQAMQWVNAAAPDTDAVVSSVPLTKAGTTYTFLAAASTNLTSDVEYPRCISLDIWSSVDSVAGIKGATLTVTGTNVMGDAVTEQFTITNDTENSQQGAIAFSTLTSFTCGAMDSHSVKVSFGIGNKLGLWNTLPTDTMILAWNGTSADASAAITPDDDEIEKNVIDFNTDPTGTSDCGVLYWIPPFATSGTLVPEANGKY